MLPGSLPMMKRLVDAGADPMKCKLKEDKKCNNPMFVVFTCEYGFMRYCHLAGALRTVANPDKLKDVINFYKDTLSAADCTSLEPNLDD